MREPGSGPPREPRRGTIDAVESPHSAVSVVYRLTREDGAEIDVAGSVWEAVLERAYQNGWRPSGTGAPWEPGGKVLRVAVIGDATSQRSWPEFDYFSASSQHVYSEDAFELGAAVLRGTRRTDEEGAPESKREALLSRVGSFARYGGFVIGRVPARAP
jgi:hypothetical protein